MGHVRAASILSCLIAALTGCEKIIGIEPWSPRARAGAGAGSGASGPSSQSSGGPGGPGGAGAAGGGGQGGSGGWAVAFPASGYLGDVRADASGYLVGVGSFEGIVDLGGMPLTSAGGLDLLLFKLDASGKHVWSERFGDADGGQLGQRLELDGDGNIYIAGAFTSTLDFGAADKHATAGPDDFDVYAARLNPGGGIVYSNDYGDAGDQRCFGMDLDGDQIVLAGSFSGLIDFGTGLLDSTGGSDIYVGPPGTWSKGFGGIADDVGFGVAVGAAGKVLMTGLVDGDMNLGQGSTSGYLDLAVISMYSNGGVEWVRRSSDLGAQGNQQGHSVAVDKDGNVLVGGTYFSEFKIGGVNLAPVMLNQSTSDVLVMKLDAGGTVLWLERLAGLGADELETLHTAQDDGAVLVAGTFTSSIDFGDGVVAAKGHKDGFVAELAADGALVWSRTWGSADQDATAGATYDFAGENVIVWGGFLGHIDVSGIPLDADAPSIFVAKFPRPRK